MYMKRLRNTGKYSDTGNCEPLSSLLISKVFWKVGIGEGLEFSVEIRRIGGGEIYSPWHEQRYGARCSLAEA